MKNNPEKLANEGAAAVITHRVRGDSHAEYEAWLNEITPLCRISPGHLDWQVVRPIPGLTETYTFIIRFDSAEHLKEWMHSVTRVKLIEKVRPLLVSGDDFVIKSGLDFWFAPDGADTIVPVLWKQYLVTWSAIYPLALVVPMAVKPTLHHLGAPDNQYIATLVVSAAIVFLMTYVVMPRYTTWIKRWLYS